jgi:hypothetical protein
VGKFAPKSFIFLAPDEEYCSQLLSLTPELEHRLLVPLGSQVSGRDLEKKISGSF